jgi:hypothetical protein
MTSHYVYSTLAAHVKYTRYHKQEVKLSLVPGVAPKITEAPIVEKFVLIKGRAGVAPPGVRKLETPLGVVTQVNDDELELLEANEVFQTHVKNGFIQIRSDNVSPEVAVAAGMESRDVSAPIVEADMERIGDLYDDKKPKGTGRFKKATLENTLV